MKTISDNKLDELFSNEHAKIITEDDFKVPGYTYLNQNNNIIVEKIKNQNKNK